MNTHQVHKAQISVFHTIRRSKSARYSELMRPTAMDSDNFKFHLKKLVNSGYIEKDEAGVYKLTATGKEFANNLDRENRSIQKQPKLSVIIIASRTDSDGTIRYLFQKRRRNPYWDFWGFVSGPIRWGVLPEGAAAHELHKQTGLTATFEVRGFYRKIDYSSPDGKLLEDKQFIIIKANDTKGELSNQWSGGYNDWLSLLELEKKEKYFSDSTETISMLQKGDIYKISTNHYSDKQY